MSMQRVCDKCDKIIEDGTMFWTVSVMQQGVTPDPSNPNQPMMMMPTGTQMDFHDNHLPDQIRPADSTAPEEPEPEQLPA